MLILWLGQRIHKEILVHDRAEYGKQILQTLAAKLSWSHFKDFIYIQDPLKREFYAEMCRHESWSVRTLRKKIDAMLFERTALSKKPDEVIVQELRDLRETDKLSEDLIELMELGQSGIHVAEYLTLLPEKALLQQKLHDAVTKARLRLENRRAEDE